VAAALAAGVDGRDRAVLHHCRAGLTELMQHRAALPSMELRTLASAHGAELGVLGFKMLLRTGSASRLLDWMERTRAAALLAVEPPTTEGIEEGLAALRAVHAELARAGRDGLGNSPELLARQAAIERSVRRTTWARPTEAEVDDVVALSSSRLRGFLDGRNLVEYGAVEGKLFAVVLQARQTRLVPLGQLNAVQDEADALVFALRRLTRPGASAVLATARRSAQVSLEQLSELLIRPLGLPGDVPLVVVPSRLSQRIPWSALHPAPVSVVPSASFWVRTGQRRARTGDVVLVAGPGLSGAAAEVVSLGELHRRPTVMSPPASTVDAVVAALDGATLAHLACHGRLRSDNPTFSSLLLSDGPLTLHELDLRGIAPHRIILAACDTAAAVGYEGDEVLGFVTALMARGTAGLVASTVMVPDLEAVALMRSLHEQLLRGATLADALHAARSALDRDDAGAFVNWCAFTAFGAA
jgi:CHAT domain-containing protein